MADKKKTRLFKDHGPAYVGWRAELLVQTALARFPDIIVHTSSIGDYGYDFVVATPTGVCFFVIVKAFSSKSREMSNIENVKELKWGVSTRILRWASKSRSPVFVFLVDADTEHGRYVRVDGTVITSGNTQVLRFPAANTIDAKGLERLLNEIEGLPSDTETRILGSHQRSSIILLDEFENLLNDPRSKEKDFVAFFEKYPEMLLNTIEKGKEVFSHVLLENSEGPSLRPDFLIKPKSSESWNIVELKRPTSRIFVREPKRLSADVNTAIAQARAYKDYFKSPRNKKLIKQKLGLHIEELNVVLVIGRTAQDISPHDKKIIKDAIADIRILTYDDVLKKLRSKAGS